MKKASPLTFSEILQPHLAKLLATINKRTLTTNEKHVQIESMALNSFLPV